MRNFSLFIWLSIISVLTRSSVGTGEIRRIPEHFHDHDEEHGEYLEIETLFKPETCDEEHSRKTKLGDNILVRYVGYIDESSKSGNRGQIIDKTTKAPMTFRIGKGQVIRGWDEGLLDMCPGEKRRLIAPPSFGYGNKGTKGGMKGTYIPPGATLRFEVELVGFQETRPKRPNYFAEMDTDNNGHITYDEMEYWFANKHPQKLPSIPPGVWEKDDKNMDGMITWQEFSGPKGMKTEDVRIIPPPSGEL